jgi:SAM-dependent methyltransferase
MSSFLQTVYPESRFGGFSDIDGTVVFYNRVRSLFDKSSIVLDVGCGRGEYKDDPIPYRKELRILRGQCRSVVGIDVDPEGKSNPFIDAFYHIDGSGWPIADSSVDLCLCDWVVEHVAEPSALFAEAARVLRPDGKLCVRTMNKFSYPGIAARLVPNRLHAKVLDFSQKARKHEDVFPTLYRCNTVGALKEQMRRHGLIAAVYGYESEPCYCDFSRAAFGIAASVRNLIPHFLRTTLFGFGRKSP